MMGILRPILLLLSSFRCAALVVDSITTSQAHGYVFIKVSAQNIDGWGQSCYRTLNDASLGNLSSFIADKIHEWVVPHALGKSFSEPEDIATFSDAVWEANYKYTGTLLAQALAGVDTALWDLVGQIKGKPVCALIQGRCKDRVKIYGSNLDRTLSPEAVVGKAQELAALHGVTAFKVKIAKRNGHDVDMYPGRTERIIALAREKLGPDATLMVDANGGLDNFTHAKAIAQLLLNYNYTWLEEPFIVWDYEKAGRLHAEVPIKIALGEQEYRLDVWQRNIGSMHFAQPDVHYIGGMSRILQVARWAEKRGVSFVPHSPNPSMIDVFTLHLMASLPNAYQFMEFDAIDKPPPVGTDIFSDGVFSLINGSIKVPSGFGWGVTLRQGLLTNAINRTSRTTLARGGDAWFVL